MFSQRVKIIPAPPMETEKGHLKWHFNSQAYLVYQSAMTPDSRLKLHSDKPVFDEPVMFIPRHSFTYTQGEENIWTSSPFTSLEPRLTCLFGPKPHSIRGLSRQTRVKSRHVSRQSMHELMKVTEATLQMMKGT